MLFSRQIIINFIRCALSRGGACARIFSRTTCSLARFQILSDSGGEYAGETKRFLLHFATQYRGWKLCPTKHFVLQCFHRPSLPLFSISFLLTLSPFLSLSLCLSLSSIYSAYRETIACVHIVVQLLRYFSMLLFRVSTNNFLSLATVSSHFRSRHRGHLRAAI